MRPVLLDTNIFTALKKSDAPICQIVQSADTILMSAIVIGELLYGYDGGNKAKQNRQQLQQFLDSPRVKIISVTVDTAHFFSQVSLALKQKGKPIPTNDVWIAAQAFEHGSVVCTYDKHFHVIEGLSIATSLADLVL